MSKKNMESTRELMGTREVTDYSIRTYRNEELVYFLIQPSNISVLSEESLSARIYGLMTVLKGITEIEMMCLNSRENFEDNKRYLKKRMEEETNPVVRKLLEKDANYLDRMQVQMATAREFLLIIRLREKKENEIFSYLNRIEKMLAEQGFTSKRAEEEDIKRILTNGHTAASIDEFYLFLTNLTAVEYIRNFMKRVRKKESAVILASQNLEDFNIDGIREYTKPLFSIPTHAFLFNAGNIDARFYIDTLQLEKSEYNLIRYPQRGVCLYKCGNERYNLMVHAPEYKEKLFGNAGGR